MLPFIDGLENLIIGSNKETYFISQSISGPIKHSLSSCSNGEVTLQNSNKIGQNTGTSCS